jgi:hypothetical protein
LSRPSAALALAISSMTASLSTNATTRRTTKDRGKIGGEGLTTGNSVELTEENHF